MAEAQAIIEKDKAKHNALLKQTVYLFHPLIYTFSHVHSTHICYVTKLYGQYVSILHRIVRLYYYSCVVNECIVRI